MPLRDAIGQIHVHASREPRIVSLVPSITELVCELGLADRLVGRTGFCIHPRELLSGVPKLGGTKDVHVPKLLALNPTHVILNIDENERSLAEALGHAAPQVHLVVTHPLGPLDNPPLYRLIGGIFDRQAQAEVLCTRFNVALQSATDAGGRFAHEQVLYLIWKDPWMTVSANTYVARTLALFNWHALQTGSELRYPELTLDHRLLSGVDRILLSSEPYRFRQHHVAEIAATTGKTVHLVDGEMTSWYGSRAIAALHYLRHLRQSLSTA